MEAKREILIPQERNRGKKDDELWESVEVRTSLVGSHLSLLFHARYGAQAPPHPYLLLVVSFSSLSFFSPYLRVKLFGIEKFFLFVGSLLRRLRLRFEVLDSALFYPFGFVENSNTKLGFSVFMYSENSEVLLACGICFNYRNKFYVRLLIFGFP